VKRILTIFFVVFAFCLAGGTSDNLGLFSKEGLERIEARSRQLQSDRNIKLYINSLPAGEGFSVTDPEKVVVFNIYRDNDEVSVALNISKDLPVDDYRDDIDLLLTNTQKLLEAKDFDHYVLEILDGLDTQLERVIGDLREESGNYSPGGRDDVDTATAPLEEKKDSWFAFNLDFTKVLLIALILFGVGLVGTVILMVMHRVQGDNDFTVHQINRRKKGRK
jgi:hypothetical protein